MQWFSEDEKTVIEGALSTLTCHRYSAFFRILWSVKDYPLEIQRIVFAAFLRYQNMLGAIRVYIDSSGHNEPTYYIIGETTEGTWFPVSANLQQDNPTLLPLINRGSEPCWHRYSGRDWLLHVFLIYLFAALTWGMFQKGWDPVATFFQIVIGIFLLHRALSALSHEMRRLRLLTAIERLRAPEPPKQRVEPQLPDWFRPNFKKAGLVLT